MDKLRPLLNDFIRAAAPMPGAGPVTELQGRYEERRRERIREPNHAQSGNYAHGSPEFLVEMRIRLWLHRMEAERAEAARGRKEDPLVPPQKRKPPSP